METFFHLASHRIIIIIIISIFSPWVRKKVAHKIVKIVARSQT